MVVLALLLSLGIILSLSGLVVLFLFHIGSGITMVLIGVFLLYLAVSIHKNRLKSAISSAPEKNYPPKEDALHQYKNKLELSYKLIEKQKIQLETYEKLVAELESQIEKLKKQPVSHPQATYSPTYSSFKTETPKEYNLFENILTDASGNSYFLKYQKEDRVCFIDQAMFDKIINCGGKEIKFIAEPENTHDKNAVAISYDGIKIGYVYKGTVQDMINDYIRRGELFGGYLNKISIGDRSATFKVGFYKPVSSRPQKEFPLLKTSKKDWLGSSRAENAEGCSINDSVSIMYDMELDAYVVYNDINEEIGELGKSFSDLVDYEDKKYIGFISGIDDSDPEKVKYKISVIL